MRLNCEALWLILLVGWGLLATGSGVFINYLTLAISRAGLRAWVILQMNAENVGDETNMILEISLIMQGGGKLRQI